MWCAVIESSTAVCVCVCVQHVCVHFVAHVHLCAAPPLPGTQHWTWPCFMIIQSVLSCCTKWEPSRRRPYTTLLPRASRLCSGDTGGSVNSTRFACCALRQGLVCCRARCLYRRELQRHKAVTIIAAHWRGSVQRRRYLVRVQREQSAIKIQSVFRYVAAVAVLTY